MAKNFKAQMREKREKTVVPQTTVETPAQDRELALPHENLNQQELKVNRMQEEPAGQIIRVGIDEVYAIEQVRPEEDFDEETIDGMKQTYGYVGILTPPRCFPKDKRGYRIWMGETRWRSAKAKGDLYIDIYVGTPPENDKKRIYGQLIENLHQSGLKPLATAIQLQALRDVHGETQEAMSRILGKPKAFISKHMRLIDAPAAVIALLRDKVTKDVDLVYTLCQINDINPDSVDKLAKLVRDGKLTRQAAIKELNVLKDKPPKKEPPVPPTESETAGTALTGDSNSSETSQLKPEPEPQSVASDSGIANGVTPSPAGQTGQPAAGGTDIEARKLKVARVLVKFEDSEGYLVTDKIPDEFGQVWVELPIGTMCIDAADISILGIKVV
ncbi:chromosome partitioning protein ParB (plasmid) [Serratia plymuthica 4Rx13]|uniref:Chromosome partitioning protein ParB n=1 Tax=Serratia plymuthica TaxID=82996 RepID=A0A318NRS5_SERPL|nr:ParB/RepB/Spo0J family partition protein [Serratia plymuthica]AGO57676.1 chromosome partitioning protein ParB [Serratia plymuthica 4Rx13]PYD36550.1 chromosome partitioning protein ParB [Serratia plymuthica]